MKITYLYHSGFLAETKDCYYLFDYYRGELPPLNTDKPILVFCSHRHPDHYNREVFSLLKGLGMNSVTAILAKDISPRSYPEQTNVVRVTFHSRYELPQNTVLETLQSTDAGVAFLVRCREGILYHAGDLNDWVWAGETAQYNKQMTGSYRHEIDLLKDLLKEEYVDAAFLPLDPRQEADYAQGILYFLKKIKVKRVYPMHYWEKPGVISRFLREYPQYQNLIQNTEDAKANEL